MSAAANPEPQSAVPVWLRHLSHEDLAFVRRFVLASGSLKAMAKAYGVSYPTVRLRLDRLIAKIEVAEDQQIASAFERTLRSHFADGRIDAQTLTALLSAHREDLATHRFTAGQTNPEDHHDLDQSESPDAR